MSEYPRTITIAITEEMSDALEEMQKRYYGATMAHVVRNLLAAQLRRLGFDL